jgi:hypothetical protein
VKPRRTREDAVVDLVDVILRDGAVVEADAIVSVAGVPLIGLKLRAAVAGMAAMTEYGMFEEWDAARRRLAEAGAPEVGDGTVDGRSHDDRE